MIIFDMTLYLICNMMQIEENGSTQGKEGGQGGGPGLSGSAGQ